MDRLLALAAAGIVFLLMFCLAGVVTLSMLEMIWVIAAPWFNEAFGLGDGHALPKAMPSGGWLDGIALLGLAVFWSLPAVGLYRFIRRGQLQSPGD